MRYREHWGRVCGILEEVENKTQAKVFYNLFYKIWLFKIKRPPEFQVEVEKVSSKCQFAGLQEVTKGSTKFSHENSLRWSKIWLGRLKFEIWEGNIRVFFLP